MGKEKKGGKGSSNFSRRDFLKTSAAGTLSSTLVARGMAMPAAGPDVPMLGPGAVKVSLTVNGTPHTLDVEPRVTLLDALRAQLDLIGAKRVCDRGTCGACSVMLDGKLVYACSVLAVEAEGRQVQTVESIGDPNNLHPLQQAIVDHDGSQCGFCTSGFVMACKSLLDHHPQPTHDEIRLHLGGNLCRCGTYVGLRDAITEISGKGGSNRG